MVTVTITDVWLEEFWFEDGLEFRKRATKIYPNHYYTIWAKAIVTSKSGEYLKWRIRMKNLSTGYEYVFRSTTTRHLGDYNNKELKLGGESWSGGEIISRVDVTQSGTRVRICLDFLETFSGQYCVTLPVELGAPITPNSYVDYVELWDADTLAPVSEIDPNKSYVVHAKVYAKGNAGQAFKVRWFIQPAPGQEVLIEERTFELRRRLLIDWRPCWPNSSEYRSSTLD